MSNTFKAYRQACLRAAQDRYIPASVCTTTSGSVWDRLVDAVRLGDVAGTSADSSRYVDMWLNLVGTGYTGQTSNECRPVYTYTPATGTLIVRSNFGGNPLTAKEFEIHKFAPAEVLERAINYVFRNLRYRTRTPLTLVTDGDFELSTAATITTYWTATNCTPTKQTAAGTVWSGKQGMLTTNSAANGYLCTHANYAINVGQDEPYVISAIGYTAGEATLTVYDVTNSAEIGHWHCSERDWFEICEDFDTPATCKQISVRLGATGAADAVYWDCVSVLPRSAVMLDLPSFVTKREHLEDIIYFPSSSRVSDDGRLMRRRESERWQGFDFIESTEDINPWRVRLRPFVGERIPWLVGFRPYPEMTADTDTNNADIDVVVPLALQRFFDVLGLEDERSRWSREAVPQRPNIKWESAYG